MKPSSEFEDDSMLARINQRHAVIGNFGGKCVVWDGWKRNFQSTGDFVKRYRHIRVPVGVDKHGKEVTREAGEWWLAQQDRRYFDDVVFDPTRKSEDGLSLNLWQGFAVEPQPGDWSLLQEHIRENLCQGDEIAITYVLDWLADGVQRVGEPAGSAIILTGEPGLGKGSFAHAYGSLFEPHFMAVTQQKQLLGNFNAHLFDKIVVFGDECFNSGNAQYDATLKAYVTEPELVFESKGVNAERGPNRLRFIVASNNELATRVEDRDRRYCVLDVGERRRNDRAFFSALKAQMKAGGSAALLHDLMRRDLSNYDPAKLPATKARLRHRQASMAEDLKCLRELVRRGSLPGATKKAPRKTNNDLLFPAMREISPKLKDWSNDSLGRCVAKWDAIERSYPDGGRRWHVFKPLSEVYARWAHLFGADEALPDEWCADERPEERARRMSGRLE